MMSLNLRSKVIASLAIASQFVLGVTTPVKANEVDQHEYLIKAIRDVGVNVVINHPDDCGKGINGLYDSLKGYISICQDNAKVSLSEVAWTANDYDTLRHEAQHLVQDCTDNALGNGQLYPMFSDSQARANFVFNSIGRSGISYVLELYKDDPSVIDLELEAFAVANTVSARSIADKVTSYCANN